MAPAKKEPGHKPAPIPLGSKMVNIIVGEERKIFSVHRCLLVRSSTYFSACLKGGFVEGNELTVTFEDDDAETFGLLVDWLYDCFLQGSQIDPKKLIKCNVCGDLEAFLSNSSKVKTKRQSMATTDARNMKYDRCHITNWVKLAILAHKFNIESLQKTDLSRRYSTCLELQQNVIDRVSNREEMELIMYRLPKISSFRTEAINRLATSFNRFEEDTCLSKDEQEIWHYVVDCGAGLSGEVFAKLHEHKELPKEYCYTENVDCAVHMSRERRDYLMVLKAVKEKDLETAALGAAADVAN